MAKHAYLMNCSSCKTFRALKAHKMDFTERPCPTVGRKQLSPYQVEQSMPASWTCEKREGVR